MRNVIFAYFLLSLMFVQYGCSSEYVPIYPSNENKDASVSRHQVWGAFEFSWDGASEEASVIQDRTVAAHYNVTGMLPPSSVKLQIISWDPDTHILTALATLTNPFPNIVGYDVRGVLYNMGVNKMLNPDDYTKLFDPNNPQVANPFRAFAKDQPNRRFGSINNPPNKHSETYQIYFPGQVSAKFLIDASYPGNCDEPYDILNINQTGEIVESSGSIEVTCDVLSWPSGTATDKVVLESSQLTGTNVQMSSTGGTGWSGTITNSQHVPPGDYDIFIAAYNTSVPYALYNVVTISVKEADENTPPEIISGVSGNPAPYPTAIEEYKVIAQDDDFEPLNFSWVLTDELDNEVFTVPNDNDGIIDIDWGSLGVAPGEKYFLDCDVTDSVNPPVPANTLAITIANVPSGDWSDPILVSGESGIDEILPRIVTVGSTYWIIYTNGNDIYARTSTNGGDSWSSATLIGTYSSPTLKVDSLHALYGNNGDLFIQYQSSGAKYTYLHRYTAGSWSPPHFNNLMGLTTEPWVCDLGISASGTILDMWNGDWSMFAHHSNNPYDMSSWTFDNIQAFYQANYSVNDGFVQRVTIPKLFYVHDDVTLDYAQYDSGWTKGAAYTGTDPIIEPAIAPESDNPYHGVWAVNRGATWDVQYFRFDNWPPSSPSIVNLKTGLTSEPRFHSISVEGNTVSVLYDADGAAYYAESTNGGVSFGAAESFGSGKYSMIRNDPNSSRILAAYSVQESGDYNIYVRYKN